MKLHLIAGIGCALVATAGVASAEKSTTAPPVSPYATQCSTVECLPYGCSVSGPAQAPNGGPLGIAVVVGAAALGLARRRAR